MRSYVFCPVSDKRIDEHAARINGALTFLLLGVFAITGSVIPVIFLAGDFFLRAFNYGQYSLIAVSSRNIVKYFQIDQNLINAGPKIFAARIGLLLSSLIVLSFLLNLTVLAYSVAGILAFFSLLESAFGLCVACEIYPFLYRLLYGVR
jgi:hypothetical protein